MKKQLSYILLLFCAALTAACSNEGAESLDAGDTGALEMRVSATRADADGEYDPLQHLVVRIYRGSSELLRQYTEQTLPARLELLAGEYRVEVEAGESVPASFTKRLYKGEKTFTVSAGKTVVAEIECKRQNVVADVKFDATVPAAFGENFHAWVVAADTFDEEQAQQGVVPALEYRADGKGYFTMPEGVTTLSVHFEGTHPERGAITKDSKFEGVQAGGKYSVSFKFSKDLPGFVECIVVKVDTSTEDHDDTFPFSPEPTIESDGFDMEQTQDFIPGKTPAKRYLISTMAALKSVKISIGNDIYDVLNNTTDGVEVVKESDLSMTVTLSDAFFAGRPGGSQPVTFRVADMANSEATAVSEYRLQGLLPIAKIDYDLWTNSITLRAMVLDPDITAATFGLRVKDGQWLDAEGISEGNGIYKASFNAQWNESANDAGLTVYSLSPGTGIFAGNSYESRAVIGATPYTAAFTTEAGQIIPGGDMEDASMSCFSTDNTSTNTWGSGNNSMKKGLCLAGEFPGMGGSQCAKLTASETIGNLAAGNLFFGTFVFSGLTGPGTVGFGQKYDYTARPRALSVKYHATVGKVNINKHNGPLQIGEDDFSQIFVCIVDWSKRRAVVSGMSAPSGMWNPADQSNLEGSGAIIAYGILPIRESTEGDEMISAEIPLLYYDKEATRPQGEYTLAISCSTSAYGDYMDGCSTNVMYVDDFEWVY